MRCKTPYRRLQSGPRAEVDERLLGEILDQRPPGLGEGARSGDQHQLLLPGGVRRQPLGQRPRVRHEVGEVQFARAQRLGQLTDRRVPHRHLDPGDRRWNVASSAGRSTQVHAGQRLDRADGHPADGQPRHRRDRLPGLLGAGQQRAGLRQQGAARLRQHDPAAGAVEQAGTQLPFEVADRGAERRLHDQLAARGGGTASPGDDPRTPGRGPPRRRTKRAAEAPWSQTPVPGARGDAPRLRGTS